MLKRIVFVGISLLITISFAQTPDTLWTRTFGGPYSDHGKAVQQTSDGGFIITGYFENIDNYDVFVIRTDAYGDTLWTKTFGGSFWDQGYEVQQLADTGYVVVGSGSGDVWFLRLDTSGDTLFTKKIGGSEGDWAHSCERTSDGGYIITGTTLSFGPSDWNVYLVKTDSLGDTLWTRAYGAATYNEGYEVQETADGGYIVVGYTGSFGSSVYLIKTDSLGDSLWTRTYGGGDDDWGFSVQETPDSCYIVVGYTYSFSSAAGHSDVWLLKVTSFGDTLWTKTYGNSVPTVDDDGYSIKKTIDGGYIIVGKSGSDVYLLKMDANLDSVWATTYGGSQWEWGSSVQQTADGGYIIVGSTTSFGAGSWDVYLIKTESEQAIEEKAKHDLQNYLFSTIFTGPLLLPEGKNCRVFDITGRVVIPDKIKPGIYFIEIDGEITQKVVKVR